MGSNSTQDEFLLSADRWLCNNYALDIRYIAKPAGDFAKIICASITMQPVNALIDNSFRILNEHIIAGQIQKYPVGRAALNDILNNVIQGKISLDNLNLEMRGESGLDYYSEHTHKNSWFSDLNLQIDCNSGVNSLFNLPATLDNELRLTQPPFDGITDLAEWLGFGRFMNDQLSTIVIKISPPVLLRFDSCKLQNNFLTIVIEIHEELDPAQVNLTIRGVPGEGIASRMNVTKFIEWKQPANGVKDGVVNIHVKNCDSVFIMLMVGASNVRRQWLLDPTKARNNRYMAIQNFDIELRQIRRALLDSGDFEKGVAALLFLLGFSPVLQLETDSPDLIVTTPAGQLLIIECTSKISGFSEKLGKLVDRRVSLSNSLALAGHLSDVTAILICRSLKSQIAINESELKKHRAILLTKEDIEELFNKVRHPHDADKMVNDYREKINKNSLV